MLFLLLVLFVVVAAIVVTVGPAVYLLIHLGWRAWPLALLSLAFEGFWLWLALWRSGPSDDPSTWSSSAYYNCRRRDLPDRKNQD